MSEDASLPEEVDSPTKAVAANRSAMVCGVVAAFLLIYVLVYPLVPIALKQSGLGQRLPDWMETGFEISAAPLIAAHRHIPAYRGYVKILGSLMEVGQLAAVGA